MLQIIILEGFFYLTFDFVGNKINIYIWGVQTAVSCHFIFYINKHIFLVIVNDWLLVANVLCKLVHEYSWQFYKTYLYAACRVTVQSGALSIIQFNITFPLQYIKKYCFSTFKIKKSFTQFSIFFNLI